MEALSDRKKNKIEVKEAFTTGDALFLVEQGKVDVRGAIVVVDCLTNDIRRTWSASAADPPELIRRVDELWRALTAAGAAAIVVCEIKPIRSVDVRCHNALLNDYLLSKGDRGYGCKTQIRMSYLKQKDGLHIRPEFASIMDRTYACALLGIHVPCPTPSEDFVPDHVRRRFEMDWPRVGRAPTFR